MFRDFRHNPGSHGVSPATFRKAVGHEISAPRVAAPLASLIVLVLLFCICHRRVTPRRMGIVQIRACHIRQYILWPLSHTMYQIFKSLGRSPCTVTVYMMSRFNGRSEFYNNWFLLALCSHLFVPVWSTLSLHRTGDTRTLAQRAIGRLFV